MVRLEFDHQHDEGDPHLLRIELMSGPSAEQWRSAAAGLREYAAKFEALAREAQRAQPEPIDRLANFIADEIPGEPSQSEGAIDTAIRLLGDAKRLGVFDTPSGT